MVNLSQQVESLYITESQKKAVKILLQGYGYDVSLPIPGVYKIDGEPEKVVILNYDGVNYYYNVYIKAGCAVSMGKLSNYAWTVSGGTIKIENEVWELVHRFGE